MEELRVRVRTEELKVKGSAEVIQREREAFYQHIKESEEANIKARVELAQRMKNDMAWYARMRQEKDAQESAESWREPGKRSPKRSSPVLNSRSEITRRAAL